MITHMCAHQSPGAETPPGLSLGSPETKPTLHKYLLNKQMNEWLTESNTCRVFRSGLIQQEFTWWWSCSVACCLFLQPLTTCEHLKYGWCDRGTAF